MGGRGEKLGLPDKWVKKTQHLKNLIVFCSLKSPYLPLPLPASPSSARAELCGPRVMLFLWRMNI